MVEWQTRPPRGAVVDDPFVQVLAGGPDPGSHPVKLVQDGITYVHYSRPRVYMDRDAWEMLPPNGVLVHRVRYPGRVPYTMALTRDELERVFGHVRVSRSWDEVRCYHFRKEPPAVASFRVDPIETVMPDVGTQTAVYSRVSPRSRSSRLVAGVPDVPAETPLHEWAHQWAIALGAQPESPEYLASVAAWRDAWRPARVRILLVAESHVAELPGDTDVRVYLPFDVPETLPQTYCRLVYCLGYGENWTCKPQPEKNPGTWQYWDIFGALVSGLSNKQPRKGGSSLVTRMNWKLDVLRRLRDSGLWLVDASLAGLYIPGGGRAAIGRAYIRMVRESYERFVWPNVRTEPIEQVWVIGRDIAGALAGCEGIGENRVISQPQDRDTDRYAIDLARLVSAVRSLS